MPKKIKGLSQREYHRRWRAANKDKVSKALKATAKDRAKRNRDRREAAKRTNVKGKDVHHPKGIDGPIRIVKKDHGRHRK